MFLEETSQMTLELPYVLIMTPKFKKLSILLLELLIFTVKIPKKTNYCLIFFFKKIERKKKNVTRWVFKIKNRFKIL
jgi:hypothetical protein